MHVIRAEHHCPFCAALSGIPAEQWDNPRFTAFCPVHETTVTKDCSCMFWHTPPKRKKQATEHRYTYLVHKGGVSGPVVLWGSVNAESEEDAIVEMESFFKPSTRENGYFYELRMVEDCVYEKVMMGAKK